MWYLVLCHSSATSVEQPMINDGAALTTSDYCRSLAVSSGQEKEFLKKRKEKKGVRVFFGNRIRELLQQ